MRKQTSRGFGGAGIFWWVGEGGLFMVAVYCMDGWMDVKMPFRFGQGCACMPSISGEPDSHSVDSLRS